LKKEFKLDEFQLRSLLDTSGSAILLTDAKGRIQYVNQRFTEITGYQPEELVGHTPKILSSNENPASQQNELLNTVTRGETWHGQMLKTKRDGKQYWAMQSVTPITDSNGNVSFYLSVSVDVNHLVTQTKRNEKLAFFDEVTGLGNRHLLVKELESQIASYQKSGGEFSLCIVKIDNLSNINEAKDSAYIQCLLNALTKRLSSWNKSKEHIYRLNTDHLVVLMTHAGHTHDLDNLYAHLQQPISFVQDLISTKLHLGYADVTPDVTESAELLLRADIALNFAIKHKLKWKCYCIEDEHDSPASIDGELFDELQHALNHNKLHLAAQPIFDLQTGEVAIVEVLLRWTHKTYGEVNPLKIIELAGKNGYLFNVASYIINKLIQFLKVPQHHYPGISFSINLNLPQIINSKLIKHLLNLLDNNGIDRSKIIFESTETDSMPVPINQATKHFHWIRSQGVRIALDDFGSGYSTLDYINSLDVDLIKIDRSLVTGIEYNARKLDTFLSLVQLCHRMGVTTVVEGIENEQQHRLITDHSTGKLLVQGYLYAKPSLLDTNQFCYSPFLTQTETEQFQLIS